MTRRFAVMGCAVALLCGNAGCGSAEGQVEQPTPRAPKTAPAASAIRVEVATLRPSNARLNMRLPGEVRGSKDALLGAPLGGYVERVHVSEGDEVRAGQVLLRVDTALYAAQRKQAEVAYEGARIELERAQRLGETIARAQLDQAQNRADAAEAALRIAQVQASRTVVKAPFAGVIADVPTEVGEVVAPGQPVVRLVRLDPIEISLSVPDRDVVALETGLEVGVRTGARGELFHGTIAHISPAADLETRTFEVKVEVPNPEAKLLPGMIAGVELASPVGEERIVLPQHVLVTRLEGNGVFIEDDGIARWRNVTLGPVVRNQVVVESGVAVGDRVVVTGHRELQDGDQLLVTRAGSCCTDGRPLFDGDPQPPQPPAEPAPAELDEAAVPEASAE